MAHQYFPSNGPPSKIFNQPPEAYPVIDLPVKGKRTQPYGGASDLANFTLWQAIDANPEVARRFADRNLWIMGSFYARNKILGLVSLQTTKDTTFLRAYDHDTALDLLLSWDRHGDDHRLKTVKWGHPQADQELHLEPGSPKKAMVGVIPRNALERDLGNEILRYPAVAASVVFGDLEHDLTRAAHGGKRSGFRHTLSLQR